VSAILRQYKAGSCLVPVARGSACSAFGRGQQSRCPEVWRWRQKIQSETNTFDNALPGEHNCGHSCLLMDPHAFRIFTSTSISVIKPRVAVSAGRHAHFTTGFHTPFSLRNFISPHGWAQSASLPPVCETALLRGLWAKGSCHIVCPSRLAGEASIALSGQVFPIACFFAGNLLSPNLFFFLAVDQQLECPSGTGIMPGDLSTNRAAAFLIILGRKFSDRTPRP